MKQRVLAALFCTCALSTGSAFAAEPVLNFYNWSDYIPSEILDDFSEQTGIKVIYSTYDNNESMYDSLLNNPTAYDLVIPSSYYVSLMRREGLLLPLDKSRLSNFEQLDPQYLNKSFDPNNQFSVPYVWGATGIGVNADMLNAQSISNWADLWDQKWESQLILLDDAREVFHIALVKLGFSPNTQDPEQIKAAYQELRNLLPNVLMFNSQYPSASFLSGEVSLGMLWSGSAYRARQDGSPVNIIWPENGTILWMDSLVIPADAQNKEAAYQMINFLLKPDNAAKISLEMGYPSPVKGVDKLLPRNFQEDDQIYPPLRVMETGIWQGDVGPAVELYNDYYQQLKSELGKQ
ncbi:extracellular solute-binding protein [Vibrio sp.]|uniref:extracellular solute-binding protein n=1 Tax=Vibrio sp. TaxID=678 RepID=UPI003D0C9E94